MSLLKALPAAALLFLPSSAATVHSLSVVPSSGKAEVVIGVNAAVEVQDFTLDAPARVVVDLKGATLDMSNRTYDKVSRGGITNVRYSQYRPNIVRVVIELDAKHPYEVKRNPNEVRVSVTGGKTAEYSSWGTASRRSYASAPATTSTAAHQTATATHDVAKSVATPAPAPKQAQTYTATPVQAKPLQATIQAQATTERADTQDEPAPVAMEPEPTPTRRTSNSDRAVGLFSQVQQSQQPPITVTFQDTDIRDVIASFAAFSGRTIVVGKDVSGTITAEVRNQPWDVALRAILQGQGLAASEDPISGIITVDSYANILNRQASEPLQTQLVSINYARANALVPTIQQLLQKDCLANAQVPTSGNVSQNNARPNCVARGLVAADSVTNTLIITETASRLADVLQYVRSLDVRTPQVGIKAKIIFVNRTNIEDIGLSYDLGTGTDQFFSQLIKRPDPSTLKPIDTNGDGVPDALGGGTPFSGDRILLGGNALSAIANANARVINPALSVVFSTALGKFQLTSFLDALQEVRLADLQAEPSIVTLDNRQASIQVGQEIPIRVLDANTSNLSGAATPNSQPRATVQMKQVGIILTVTPHITNNRQILLLLHAENSDAQLASSDAGYIFGKQAGDTQLLVGDGETAVIGGLTVTQTTQSKSGIPLLVDLPLIGRLFGETRTQDEKRDLLILVTPHIVDDGASVPGSSPNSIPPATR
jgi:type IV pilus assembly protein PilQ